MPFAPMRLLSRYASHETPQARNQFFNDNFSQKTNLTDWVFLLSSLLNLQVDSARRHGILLEAVQVLTDLNLSIKKAYISSDVRWFMDGKRKKKFKLFNFVFVKLMVSMLTCTELMRTLT